MTGKIPIEEKLPNPTEITDIILRNKFSNRYSDSVLQLVTACSQEAHNIMMRFYRFKGQEVDQRINSGERVSEHTVIFYKCNSCGKYEIRDTSKFCAHCGTAVHWVR